MFLRQQKRQTIVEEEEELVSPLMALHMGTPTGDVSSEKQLDSEGEFSFSYG